MPPERKRIPLQEGMLLLDPGQESNDIPARPSIYAVASKGGKVLVQHLEECSLKATVRKPFLPDGWLIIDNRGLAKYLIEHKDEFLPRPNKGEASGA